MTEKKNLDELLQDWKKAHEEHSNYCTLAMGILSGECTDHNEGTRDQVIEKMLKLERIENAARQAFIEASGGFSLF